MRDVRAWWHGNPTGLKLQLLGPCTGRTFWPAIRTGHHDQAKLLNCRRRFPDVLFSARKPGDVEVSVDRISRPGFANNDMHNLVKAFELSARYAEASGDGEMVRRILRRLVVRYSNSRYPVRFVWNLRWIASPKPCILITISGSISTRLREIARRIDANADGRNREWPIGDSGQLRFRFAGERYRCIARAIPTSSSDDALGDIYGKIDSATCVRYGYIWTRGTACFGIPPC